MYEVQKSLGGGTSWWYLLDPTGRIVCSDQNLSWLRAVQGLLNTTLKT